MGKHKHKSKKSKKKHAKKKAYSDSSDASCDSSENNVVWTECSVEKSESPKHENIKEDNKEFDNENTNQDANTGDDDESDWFNLLDISSKSNIKQSILDRDNRKKQEETAQNKIRYTRELNSYYKDDVTKKFIEDPDEFWDQKRTQKTTDEHLNENDDQHQILSDSERNVLNSKIIKAELLGNIDLANELKEKLKQLESGSYKGDGNVEYLVPKQSKSVQKDKEDKMSVKELYFQTKNTSTREEAMRFVASSSKLRSNDDEYEEIKMKKKKIKLQHLGFERIKQNDEPEKCNDCFEKFSHHLVLKFNSNFKHCFVAFPQYEPFVKNYCQIRSKAHLSTSTLNCNEECWLEIRQIMRLLASFFDQRLECSIIFLETYFMHQKRSQNISKKHFVIECIPIKKRLEADARIFFHKAIMECGEEWSMNKKLIKLDNKPVTKMIPKGLAYFWVSFGANFNGFAHVIEDEDYFHKDFGKEIIGGLRDIEPVKWLKPKFENYDTQLKRVIEVKNKWNDFIEMINK